MSLPVPNLDDRRFQDLVDDGKRLVQARCPEWTDHNVSDPGVTLIETFAYMTDQLLYRLNRVPDRIHLKFLDLIGLRLLRPTAATAPITFWLSAPATTTLTVATGTRVGTVRTESMESIDFSTLEDLSIPPRTLSFVRASREPDGSGQRTAKSSDHDEQGSDADTDIDQQLSTVDCTALLSNHTPCAAFRAHPQLGDVLLLGLDEPAPQCAIRIDYEGEVEGVGVNPDRPPLTWEAWTGHEWTECELSSDETGGLNRDGGLVLHIPQDHQASVVEGDRAGWLRARVVEPELGQSPYASSPVIHALTVSTVGGTVNAINADVIDREVLGDAEGVPGQQFTLSRSPVVGGSSVPVVECSSAQGWQSWTEVEDFASSGPGDKHFVLDAYSGLLLFGPAVRQPDGTMRQYGAVPEKGETIRIRRYATGGGHEGNVTAGSLKSLRSSIPFVAAVENRVSAQGGVDGETLDEAKVRAPLFLRTRSRAVTVNDYETLAKQAAPEVARVRCVPAGEATTEPGAVRILVVPAANHRNGRVQFADLVPRVSTLDRICRRLDEVRLIGTRISTEPPLYRGVTVVARLVARPRTSSDRIRSEALRALYTFLSPLPGGGPDGAGWPFGRPVQAGELFGLLQSISGVDLVEDVRLFAADPVTGVRGEEVRRIDLDANSLVFSFDHHLRVEVR